MSFSRLENIIFQNKQYLENIIFHILFIWKIVFYFVENIIFQNIGKMEKEISVNKSPKFEENPFIEGAIQEIEERTVIKQKFGTRTDHKGIVSAVDTETGEVFQTSFLRRVELDEDKFAKLYLNQLASLNELSTAGIRVLTYIMRTLKPNKAEILLNRDKCKEFCKYKSLKPIYKGLAELIQANMIARGWVDGLYYINPLVFFNGNRVVFATEYIKKKNPELKGKTLHRLCDVILQKRNNDTVE